MLSDLILVTSTAKDMAEWLTIIVSKFARWKGAVLSACAGDEIAIETNSLMRFLITQNTKLHT